MGERVVAEHSLEIGRGQVAGERVGVRRAQTCLRRGDASVARSEASVVVCAGGVGRLVAAASTRRAHQLGHVRVALDECVDVGAGRADADADAEIVAADRLELAFEIVLARVGHYDLLDLARLVGQVAADHAQLGAARLQRVLELAHEADEPVAYCRLLRCRRRLGAVVHLLLLLLPSSHTRRTAAVCNLTVAVVLKIRNKL